MRLWPVLGKRMSCRSYWSKAQCTDRFLSSTLATMSSTAFQSSLLRMLPVLSDTLSMPPAKRGARALPRQLATCPVGGTRACREESCGFPRAASRDSPPSLPSHPLCTPAALEDPRQQPHGFSEASGSDREAGSLVTETILGAAPYRDGLIWRYVCLLQVYLQVNSVHVHSLSLERSPAAVCKVREVRDSLQVQLCVPSPTAVHSSGCMPERVADYSA